MTLNAIGLSAVRSGQTILHPTLLEIEPRGRIGLVGASGSGNPLGLTGLAIPFAVTDRGVPWGLTLYTQPGPVDAAFVLAETLAVEA